MGAWLPSFGCASMPFKQISVKQIGVYSLIHYLSLFLQGIFGEFFFLKSGK